MESFSQYYSDYMCTNEFSELPIDPMTSSDGSSTASAMHAEVNLPFSDINGAVSSMVPFDSDISCSSSMSSMAALWFPETDRLGASATVMPTNYDTSPGIFSISGNEGFSSCAGNRCHQHDQAYDFGDQECSVLSSNFWPLCSPMTFESWEIQGGITPRIEEASTLKVTRYSAEERKDRILKYLKKRSQRNFNKTIKYACRKTLADKRIRVRGRFAKNNEFCEDDQTAMVKTDHNLQEAKPCYNESDQMKPHDEEWLQETIANLMYYRLLPDNSMVELPDKYLQ